MAANWRSVQRHECCSLTYGKTTSWHREEKPGHCAEPSGIDGRFPVGSTAHSAESSRAGNGPKASEL
jgi:hypothetical protein